MRLTELRIRFKDFGENEGKYVGTARFENEKGDVGIVLSPQHCEKIFDVCAEGIIETAKEAATDLAISIVHEKKIEDI